MGDLTFLVLTAAFFARVLTGERQFLSGALGWLERLTIELRVWIRRHQCLRIWSRRRAPASIRTFRRRASTC